MCCNIDRLLTIKRRIVHRRPDTIFTMLLFLEHKGSLRRNNIGDILFEFHVRPSQLSHDVKVKLDRVRNELWIDNKEFTKTYSTVHDYSILLICVRNINCTEQLNCFSICIMSIYNKFRETETNGSFVSQFLSTPKIKFPKI